MEQKQRNYVQDLKAWDLLRLEELEIRLVDELMAAGAHAVLPDLAETDRVLATLLLR